jgi:gluconokinase
MIRKDISTTMSEVMKTGDQQLYEPTGWIWFVMGPTASGKSTVAKCLAEALDFQFIEGDDVRMLPLLVT